MSNQISFKKFISLPNLELAWRRITTGNNHAHKHYFRNLYYAYETALIANLGNLHERLHGGSFRPQPPTRIYLPKPSGLQRPITLLSIEDQIVLQAIANCFALRLAPRRRSLELQSVFSNLLQKEKASIFFLQDWHSTYYQFERKIEALFNMGLRWIAHFDLAAFYDTISHDLLLRTAFPRGGFSDGTDKILGWLKTWSSERQTFTYGHGIPQGPIASDFLAECFLLPIDELLTKEFSYLRYVDDIRLFGSSELEVRKAAIQLEVLCRERGLIPQGKKFAITEAQSLEDALGMLPSIAPPNREETSEKSFSLPAEEAIAQFESSLDEEGNLIADKTRARYVLYRAEPSQKLLKHVLKLLARHPEHIDAFVYHLRSYQKSKQIVETCLELLQTTPYEYVQGEMWHLLARMLQPRQMPKLIDEAVVIAKNKNSSFAAKWGACHFLCSVEQAGLGNYASFVKYQENVLLQALLTPALPDRRFLKDHNLLIHLLKRSLFEPGIALARELARHQLVFTDLQGLEIGQLPDQVRNVFQAVGIVPSESAPVDPMGEILSRRFGIKRWMGWKELFGPEYVYALQLLSQADPVFDSGRSHWLSYQNSFNHALFLALQRHLQRKSLPGEVKTQGRDGKLISFGTLVDANQPFAKHFPQIAEAFRAVNSRRNALPGSHPYEAKGGARARHLKKGEQTNLTKKLSTAYVEIIDLA